ncbi:hypothetical protein ACFVJ4_38480 [Streptomyces sp. NPDC127178]|uniref:hypothetical protein n=1 Tax=unclassified Streptomyces TaxID=2593676 RepID=UPI003633D5F1
MATVEPAPSVPGELTRAHVDAFYARPDSASSTRNADLRELQNQFRDRRLHSQLPADAFDALNRRLSRVDTTGVGGYSSGELDRLTAAARADTARIVRRIRAAEKLVRQLHDDPHGVPHPARQQAEVLSDMAETGDVPWPQIGRFSDRLVQRTALASQLFLTWRDLAPLMVLLALVTERNGETLKELPARHRILEDRAVEVVVLKRRHGNKRWTETVTWEIGPTERELHTSGGLYLLLLELTTRSRGFCGSSAAVCLWSNGYQRKGQGEHWAPFELSLRHGANMELSQWAATRAKPVLADPPPEPVTENPNTAKKHDAGPTTRGPQPLKVTFNRIKTSADARRTKQLGGHLPSSAKSNTAQVLFRNYLKPDEATREWAEEVMTEALADAEQAAWDAHAAALGRRGEPTVIPKGESSQQFEDAGLDPHTARELADGGLDTAWTACEDQDHHPETGAPCGDSFLACFHCGNCLITRTHLPKLLALLKALGLLRERMSEDAWWERYGPAWVAVRRDILAKFTPAEVDKVRQQPLPDALLDLVEAPWEQP